MGKAGQLNGEERLPCSRRKFAADRATANNTKPRENYPMNSLPKQVNWLVDGILERKDFAVVYGDSRKKNYEVADDLANAIDNAVQPGAASDFIDRGWWGLPSVRVEVVACRRGVSNPRSKREHIDLPPLDVHEPESFVDAVLADGGAGLILIDEPRGTPEGYRYIAERLGCAVLVVADGNDTELLFRADAAFRVKPDRPPFAGIVEVTKGPNRGRQYFFTTDPGDCECGDAICSCEIVDAVWPHTSGGVAA